MGRNVPSGDVNRITIGPGIVFVGPVGATPLFDVGFHMDDMSFIIQREAFDVKAGAPQLVVERLAFAENIALEFKSTEQNMYLLSLALGDGVSSMVGTPDETLELGGKQSFAKCSLRFRHIAADGSTFLYDIWKAVGSGSVENLISVESPHEYPMHFDAMHVTTDWGAAALVDGKNLVKVTRTKV